MKKIIITRPQNQSRKLIKMLGGDRILIKFLPLLKFKHLNAKISDYYDFYIVTSQNAIKSIEINLSEKTQFLTNGKRLHKLVSKRFPNNAVINAGKYAEDIFKYINTNIKLGKFCHLRGEDISFSFNADEYITYSSMINIKSVEKILELTKHDQYIITFFSSKAAGEFVNLAKNHNMKNNIAVCFSKKIASQIPQNIFKQCLYSEPDMEDFAKLLLNILDL